MVKILILFNKIDFFNLIFIFALFGGANEKWWFSF